MKALMLGVQGTVSVSHANATVTTNTAAYCRKKAPVKLIHSNKSPIRLTFHYSKGNYTDKL